MSFLGNLDFETFGKRVSDRRTTLNMTQEQLAKKVKIGRDRVIQYEKGKLKEGPSYDVLVNLCNALNCTPNYLFGIDEFPTPTHEEIEELTSLSNQAIDTLLNLTPAEVWFLDDLLSSSDFANIANKYVSHITVLNTIPQPVKANKDGLKGKRVLLDLQVDGQQLPRVPIQEAPDYTRFELSRAFINFSERNKKNRPGK